MSQPALCRWLAPTALPFTFALVSLGAHAAPPDGCAAPRVLLERFVPADCEACWRSGEAPTDAPLVLDWIVPGARGDDAALVAAAVPEALPRAGALPASRTLERRHALRPASELAVSVEDGPAWNGYIAAQVRVDRHTDEHSARGTKARSAKAVVYLALVEQVRAGEEGTSVDHLLVRSVVGPLSLEPGEAVVTHLHAFRIPQGSKPARLTAVGWVELPGGAVIAATRAEPEDCMPAR